MEPEVDAAADERRDGGRTARSGGRFGLAFSLAVLAMFVVMWAGFAYALLVDPDLLEEAWAWLTGLSTPVAVVVWVLFLPIAVGLWIWNSSWAPVVGVLLAIGMVAWTLVAVNGVMRALRAR